MPNYRRAQIAGGTYFFTVVLADRSARLLTDHVDLLRGAFADVKSLLPFTINAIVVLPDHLHCVWTLPDGDHDFSSRWRRIKAAFSRAIPSCADVTTSQASKGERGIWQRRFWEHLIRDDADYDAHVSYIHYNPVKHGHVARASDWPHSSFHRFVRSGIYAADWAAGENAEGSFGE